MSTRLSWSPRQTTLAAQARKALHVINEVNSQCDYSNTTASDIVPILTSGSEIWGSYVHESIERVHSTF